MGQEEMTNVQKLQVDKAIIKAKEELKKDYINYEKLEILTGFGKEMIGILHNAVAKGTTVSELAYFLMYCKGVGLNPLNKEIWCYKDSKENLIMFTGRDGFLKKNKENPLYQGMRSSEVCEFDEFEIDMIEGRVRHNITSNRGKPVGAYAIVYVEGKKDTIVYIDFDEFDLGQAKWKSSPKMMVKKCAQSLALKEAAGMTGIQAEEAFEVRNNIAYGQEEKQITNGKEIKEESRLLALIENVKTEEDLRALFQHCQTPATIAAYDKKAKEFE